ncbi:MAG TPA: SDR family oxidoreductase, partial [Chloroflexota bacterium]|nr:SDR family oxidoreductase [Chloroflexota bacterium]
MTTDLFSLAGKTALVTGGNGGIGRAIALGFRGAGARVFVTGRNEAKNEAIAAELGDPAAVLPLDVRDETAVAQVVTRVLELTSRLDILVNNAGNTSRRSALDLDRATWQSIIETHLSGAFYCAQQAARAMIAGRAGGKIINIGSMYSLFGPPNIVAYASAKTGLLGLTRALAVEFATHNIQVNALLPGWYETDLTRGLLAGPA